MPIARFSVAVSAVATAMASIALTGCASSGDPIASAVVASGQYEMYDCPALKTAMAAATARRTQLKALMVQAGSGPVGRTVSATTYEPEDIQLRGQLTDMRRTANEKNCNFAGAAGAKAAPPKK